MSIPTYAGVLLAAPDADWLEYVDCYAVDSATPRDFVGSQAEIALYRPTGGAAVATLTTQAGTCELTWAVNNGPLCRVQARWPQAAVSAAALDGQYTAEIRVFGADGSVECVGLLKQVVFGRNGGSGRPGWGVRVAQGGGAGLATGGPTGRPGAATDFNALLSAMRTAGVLSPAQVQAITDALNGSGPIVQPIPGGALDFSDPDNSALAGG